MLSTTIKRSVATLGVAAGLLAAAGPASAQVMPGTMGVTTPHPGSQAPANAGTQVGSEGVKARSTEQLFDNTPMDDVVVSGLRGEAIDIIP